MKVTECPILGAAIAIDLSHTESKNSFKGEPYLKCHRFIQERVEKQRLVAGAKKKKRCSISQLISCKEQKSSQSSSNTQSPVIKQIHV